MLIGKCKILYLLQDPFATPYSDNRGPSQAMQPHQSALELMELRTGRSKLNYSWKKGNVFVPKLWEQYFVHV